MSEKVFPELFDIDFNLELKYPQEVSDSIDKLLQENKLRFTMDYFLSGDAEVRHTFIQIVPIDELPPNEIRFVSKGTIVGKIKNVDT